MTSSTASVAGSKTRVASASRSHRSAPHASSSGEDPLALCGFHVECDAPLVAVEHCEVEAVDIGNVTQLLARVVPAGSLQFDDVRTQPRQDPSAGRPRLDMRHVQDTHALECFSQDNPLICASTDSRL